MSGTSEEEILFSLLTLKGNISAICPGLQPWLAGLAVPRISDVVFFSLLDIVINAKLG